MDGEKITEPQNKLIHKPQNKLIHKLYSENKIGDIQKENLLEMFGAEHTTDLTKVQASKLIEELAKMPKTNQAEIVDKMPEPAPEQKADEKHLPQQTGMDIVRPMVSPDAAKAVWDDYEELKRKIITKDDIQNIQGKEFIKKSGWRKLATIFNLTDEIIEEIREPLPNNQFVWRIKVKVTAKNGRTTIGVGACASNERKFSHLENDCYCMAHTRAKSRGISDMVGAGGVSAEEMGEDEK